MFKQRVTATTAPAIAAYARVLLDSGTTVYLNGYKVAEGTRVGNSPDHGLVFTQSSGVMVTIPSGEYVEVDVLDLDA